MSALDAFLDSRLDEAFSQGGSSGSSAGSKFPRADRQARAKRGPATATGGGGSRTYDESKHRRASKGSAGGGRFISKGASGGEVRYVQRQVGASVDGQFGDQTARRVRSFQRKHGLQVDGVVGRQTALAMAGRYESARKTNPGSLGKAGREALASARSRDRASRRSAAAKKPAAPKGRRAPAVRARGGRTA